MLHVSNSTRLLTLEKMVDYPAFCDHVLDEMKFQPDFYFYFAKTQAECSGAVLGLAVGLCLGDYLQNGFQQSPFDLMLH